MALTISAQQATVALSRSGYSVKRWQAGTGAVRLYVRHAAGDCGYLAVTTAGLEDRLTSRGAREVLRVAALQRAAAPVATTPARSACCPHCGTHCYGDCSAAEAL